MNSRVRKDNKDHMDLRNQLDQRNRTDQDRYRSDLRNLLDQRNRDRNRYDDRRNPGQHIRDNLSQSNKRGNDYSSTQPTKRRRYYFIHDIIHEYRGSKINDSISNEIKEKLALDSIESIEKRIKDLSFWLKESKDDSQEERVIVEIMVEHSVSALNRELIQSVNTNKLKNVLTLFYNLGNFAFKKYLFIKLCTKSLTQLIITDHIETSKVIAMLIYSLGKLAHAGCLEGTIPKNDFLEPLLTRFYSLPENSHEISNVIQGLGRLAHAGCFEGTITIPKDADNHKGLLTKLYQSNPNSLAISNVICGLGEMAEKGVLNTDFQSELIITLIQCLLKDKNASEQDNYISLIGLIKLTKAGYLNLSEINRSNNCINALFEKSKNHFLTFHKIHTKFNIYFLAKLVQCTSAAFIKEIPPEIIFKLIAPYTQTYLYPSTAAKILNSLIILNEKDERFAVPSKLFAYLVEAIDLPIENFDPITNDELKNSLSKLNGLNKDYYNLLKRQLYPPKVTESEENGDVSAETSSLKTINFSLFNNSNSTVRKISRQSETIQNPTQASPSRVRKEGHSQAHSLSKEQPRSQTQNRGPSLQHSEVPSTNRLIHAPVRQFEGRQSGTPQSTTRSTSLPKNIYQCLKTGNLDLLKEFLLSLDENLKLKQSDLDKLNSTTSTSNHSNTTPLIKDNQSSQGGLITSKADKAVLDFFEKTPISDLKPLINKENAQSFSLLIDVCSKNKRYALAKNSYLNLVIRHLPFDDLEPFIKNLENRGLYLDSNAVIKICDAYSIREIKESRQQNKEKIKQLAQNFFSRAIEYHKGRNNRHVVAKLEAFKNRKNYTLLPDDDDDKTQTITTPVRTTLSSPANVNVSMMRQQSLFAPSASAQSATSVTISTTTSTMAPSATRN